MSSYAEFDLNVKNAVKKLEEHLKKMFISEDDRNRLKDIELILLCMYHYDYNLYNQDMVNYIQIILDKYEDMEK